MTKLIIALMIVVFAGFIIAVEIAYDQGFGDGYMSGLAEAEKRKKDGE